MLTTVEAAAIKFYEYQIKEKIMTIFVGPPKPVAIGRIRVSLIDDTHIAANDYKAGAYCELLVADGSVIETVSVKNLMPHMTTAEKQAFAAFFERIRPIAESELIP